jgi:putative PEP-CTERM system TPR-repeat lipoprotein
MNVERRTRARRTQNGERRTTTFCLIVLCVLAASGCGERDPLEAFREHVTRGDDYAAKRQYAEAIIEYRNAVQLAPNIGSARFKLAQAYESAEQWPAALAQYIRAADMMPDNMEAQLKAGGVLLMAGEFRDAEDRARRALQINPEHAPALLLLGNAHAGLQNLDEAIAANQRALALDPERAGLHLNLGVLQFAKGDLAQAEAVFKQAIALDPASIDAHVALGKFYWASQRPADAERAFHEALKLDPRHLLANRAMAAFLIDSGRIAAAEPYVTTVAEVSTDTAARVQLADYYVALGRLDDAVAELARAANDTAVYAPAMTRQAIIQYLRGNVTGANATLDTILTRDPRNALALAYKAQFQLADNQPADALETARMAVSADVRSKHGHYALGRVFQSQGDLELARRAFTDVLTVDPGATEALVELSRVHLMRNEVDSAIDFARRAVEASPRRLDLVLTLVRTLMVRSEDFERAQPVVDMLLKAAPDSVDVQVLAGDLARLRGDLPAARRSFDRAFAIDPESADALQRLFELDVLVGQTDRARGRLDTALARAPLSVPLLLAGARFYAQHVDPNRAIPLLRRVLNVDANNLEAYSALGAIYISQRKHVEARTELEELARLQPKDIAAPTMVGLIHHLEGNLDDAQRWYERALGINARAPVAANNLAYLLAERGESLDRAQYLAQIAVSEVPNQAEMLDTLGWVYLKQDMPGQAILSLRQATDRDPDNPLYHFHLGIAQSKQGLDAAARTSLERALQLDPKAPWGNEARERLKTLLY